MNIDWKYPFFEAGEGVSWPKISGARKVNELSTDLSYSIRMSAELSFVLTDRQTDGRTGFTIAKTALHTMQRGNVCTLTSHMTK